MRLSEAVKPISYLKSHAAEIIRHFSDDSSPIIITQNGEAKAVLQDIKEYERMQENIILLKLLLIGKADIDAGRIQPLKDAFSEVKKELQEKVEE